MRCVIAGGGTGGHLFPGVAVAEAFMEREPLNEILFIGTAKGIEARLLPGGRFPLRTIRSRPLEGKSLLEKGKAFGALPSALFEAVGILKSFQPRIVVGIGGYASGPALVAAWLLGIKRAIHEQNVVPGKTNRMLRWVSQRIFVSFEETKKCFPQHKTVVTGNPVRREILACMAEGRREAGRKEKNRFTLLVFGGSAGAHRLNEAMIESLPALQELKPFLRIIHQTGSSDCQRVSDAYRKAGFEAVVSSFFDRMAPSYEEADLVICRAGAGAIAELAVCGKAAILIPYPFAAHDHQSINARGLVAVGAAKLIRDQELTGRRLAEEIFALYQNPEERLRMATAIAQVGRPKAAESIVNECYALVEGK
jgi:UDP-N-acetylglucosamine--N-acetylmuramyl-(pentapeptide) pyrophosphoryl-undecaprenol N-acetylglucosamine transferase